MLVPSSKDMPPESFSNRKVLSRGLEKGRITVGSGDWRGHCHLGSVLGPDGWVNCRWQAG